LFDEKFPEKKNKPNKYEKIKKYNILRFEKEHIEIKNDKRMCFKCQCFNNINQDYIDIIFEYFCKYEENNRKKKKKWKLLEDDSLFLSFNYIIIGDVLGNVTLLQNNSKKKKSKSNEDDLSDYKIIKKLTDHYKQIKYIDYNPRLNLFLSYSLDGFINIYVFPKCKLVRAIKVNNITNSNEILKKVVLISNPFPMIFTYDKKNMYTITLNGDLIKKEELKKENIEIYPCVDKNCGLINDCILIEYGDNRTKKEISLPLLI
jgi:WD40 repeat protein